MLWCALALTACGGGGGGGGSTATSSSATSPTPAPAAPAASTVVDVVTPPADAASNTPTVSCTSGDVPQMRSATFTLINLTRQTLGLPQLARLPALDTTAQAHAQYAVANGSLVATETAGLPCFTGVDFAQRLAGAGVVTADLPGRRTSGEIFAGAEAANGAEAQSWDYVSNTLSNVYGRMLVLDPRLQQLGLGFSSAPSGSQRAMVLDAALLQGTAATSSDTWALWPRDGATGLPTRMSRSNMKPLDSGLTEGYPITLHAATSVQISRFVLTTAADGQAVPATVLTSANDRNAFLAEGEVALLPHAALTAGTTYRVELDAMVGTTPVHVVWSFTTAL